MKRTMLVGGTGVLLAALIAGGVFLGVELGRSDNGGPLAASDDGGDEGRASSAAITSKPTPERDSKAKRRPAPRVLELSIDDGSGPVSAKISIEPSPDLPDSPSEVSGVFSRRQDNSIYVGTGAVKLDLDIELVAGGAIEPTVTLSHSGPVVEVVVTHETMIYRDETEIPGFDDTVAKGGEQSVQQVIIPVDSLDELGKNTELQVWGRRSGDRVVAEVLVFRIVNPNLPI